MTYREDLLLIQKKFGYKLSNEKSYMTMLNRLCIQSFLVGNNKFEKYCNSLEFIAKNKDIILSQQDHGINKDDILAKVRTNVRLSQLEQDLLVLIEFFDDLMKFEHWSEQDKPSIYQQSLIDVSRQIPWDDFRKFRECDPDVDVNKHIKNLIANSEKLSNRSCNSLTNIYHVNEWNIYLDALEVNTRKQATDLTLYLTSPNTMDVVLLYLAETQSWYVNDLYYLPPKKIELIEFSDLLKSRFQASSNLFPFLAFNTEIFCRNINQKTVKDLTNTLTIPAEGLYSDYRHSKFLEMKSILGYKIGAGLCHGYAMMAIQSLLAGSEQFAKFSKRIHFLANHSDFLFNTTSQHSYEKIKAGIVAKRDAARNEIKRQLTIQNKTLPKYIEVNVELSEEEQNTLEIAEFFEGIAIYQNPDKFHKIDKSLISQSSRISASKHVQSQKLENLGGISQEVSFLGMFDQNNYARCLEILNEHVQGLSCNVGLLIASGGHAIAILHEAGESNWILIDATYMRPQKLNLTKLSYQVFESLKYNMFVKRIAIFSAIFVNAQDKAEIKKLITALQNSDEFKKLHETHTWVDDGQVNLVWFAAKDGFLDIISAAVNSKNEQINALLDTEVAGYSPLLVAVQHDQFKALLIFVDARTHEGNLLIDMNKTTPAGDSASHIAARYNLHNIIQILINAKKDDGSCRVNLDLSNQEGKTPLWIALEEGNHDILKMLATTKDNDGKTRVNLNFKFHSKSLVAFAYENADHESLNILKECGANVEELPKQQRSWFGGWSNLFMPYSHSQISHDNPSTTSDNNKYKRK